MDIATRWGALGMLGALLVLADVSPVAGCSCRSDRPSGPTYDTAAITITVPDCGCVRGPIEVTVDGRGAGSLSCGFRPLTIAVTVGEHRVSAAGQGYSWDEKRVEARSAVAPVVEFACPSAAEPAAN